MQTFKLIKGEISFDRDKIIIVDDAKKQKAADSDIFKHVDNFWDIFCFKVFENR